MKMIKGNGASVIQGKAERAGTVWSGEEKAQQGTPSNIRSSFCLCFFTCLFIGWHLVLFVCFVLFQGEEGQKEQAAQRGCRDPSLGGIQNPASPRLEKAAPADLALSKGTGIQLQRPLPIAAIL